MMERLLALQTLLRLGDSTSPAQKLQIEQLRGAIPNPILAHFLRQHATGRKGIAWVRNGICGECHIRVSQSMTQTLAKVDDLVVCESCGAYLMLAPEVPVATAALQISVPKRRKARKATELKEAANDATAAHAPLAH